MLKINNLHAYYGKSHVLHGVHLTCSQGEIVALLGRNGSGRSTTAKAIMGLVDCQGSSCWKGRRSWAQSLRDRPPGPGLRAREPRHFPQAHRAPEPAAGPKGGKRQRQPLVV
jgi:ABC-type glutathione transport system ATPase component